jgi:hypothetical protein
MKTTIIFLGVAAFSFTNIIAANELKEQTFDKQQEFTAAVLENISQENGLIAKNQEFLKNIEGIDTNDTAIFNPTSVVKPSNVKTMEEIISENNLITETTEVVYLPITLEKTIEDSIVEFNQIIESNDTNEVYPLDFEKINRSLQCLKVSNNKATVIIDLKL